MLMKRRKKTKNRSMRQNFIIRLFLFLIFMSQFSVKSQINIDDVKYSITSNRTLWRTHYFFEKFKDSTNGNSYINKRSYKKLFFKRNEAEKIYLEKLDSLEDDLFVFYEFSFIERCSFEGDEEFNSTLDDYIKEWNDTTAAECECCQVLSMTGRDGELYGIPNCVNEKGVIAISKLTTNEMFFISGKCIFINEKFGSIYFEKKGVNIKSVETYICLKFWNEFKSKKYSLKELIEKDENHWGFTICKNKDCNKSSKYLLNIKTGKILQDSK